MECYECYHNARTTDKRMLQECYKNGIIMLGKAIIMLCGPQTELGPTPLLPDFGILTSLRLGSVGSRTPQRFFPLRAVADDICVVSVSVVP